MTVVSPLLTSTWVTARWVSMGGILLSPTARVDTKPQLEIFADDVKCTHGATVGQLDPEQWFYLRSRGIPRDEARRILTFAFANDIVARIQVEQLRDELEQFLVGRD